MKNVGGNHRFAHEVSNPPMRVQRIFFIKIYVIQYILTPILEYE